MNKQSYHKKQFSELRLAFQRVFDTLPSDKKKVLLSEARSRLNRFNEKRYNLATPRKQREILMSQAAIYYSENKSLGGEGEGGCQEG